MPAIFNNKRIWKIAVFFPHCGNISRNFYRGIARYAQLRRNFIVDPCVPVTPSDLDAFTKEYDGIIAETFLIGHDHWLRKVGLPIVDLTGNFADDPAFIQVDFNCAKIGRIAAEWLMQRGFTNFAYLGFSGMPTSGCDIESAAFSEALAKAGHTCDVLNMDAGTWEDPSKATTALTKWLSNLPRHTAVFCANDNFAFILQWRCMSAGRSVPDDIAILGGGNDESKCLCAPISISSTDSNWQGLGYAAIRILINMLEHPIKPKRRSPFLVPPGSIVERESTAIYPVEPPWLAKALYHIDKKMDRPLSATDLAKAAGVSATTLQTAFRRTFGTSAGQYILAAKMREARRLAEAGELSVKEIAARTGFESQNYFSRAYRKYYGRPPSLDRSVRQLGVPYGTARAAD